VSADGKGYLCAEGVAWLQEKYYQQNLPKTNKQKRKVWVV
jgi:hypothetical protein